MNRIDIALAIARGDMTPEQGADLIKKSQPVASAPIVKAAPKPADPLVKGGSWVDIPGDEHGGEQKLYQDRFIRRWPSAEKARAAATRYEKMAAQAAVARDAADAAGTNGAGALSPYNGAEWRHRELARYAAEYAELLGKSLTGDDDLFKSTVAVQRIVAREGANAWTPPQTNIDFGEPGALVKGFSGTTRADRGVLRLDAFANVAEPRLQKGGGDVGLRGVGAGFDARWNSGLGVGRE